MEENEKIYEIDVNKKYILAFEDMISDETFHKIRKDIDAWLQKKESPLLLIRGAGRGVRLVCVGDLKPEENSDNV